VKDDSQQKTETEGWLHKDRRDPFPKQGWRWNLQRLIAHTYTRVLDLLAMLWPE
jgi:hypothetical protein